MTDIEIIKKSSATLGIELKETDEGRGYQLNESGEITGISLAKAGLRNLNKIITYLTQLKSLTALDLSENDIIDIESLIELKSLTSLNLYNNDVIDISVLTSLTELREINLGLSVRYSDGLTSLDGQEKIIRDLSPLQNMVNLNSLNLRHNHISDLSPLQGMVNLNSLDLSYNLVNDLSPLQGLVNLNSLNLRYNKIKKIEEWITDFEMEIAFIDKLTEGINLFENPIENVPVDIIKGGKQSIIDYFDQIRQAKGKTEYLYESKLLIIGEGGTGKTTFARKLIDAEAEKVDKDDTTLGIDITQWNFTFPDPLQPVTEEETFYVNLWDFGGQGIYQGTHQIFFCHKTFYVLVDDTREEKTDFAYWLNTVEQLGGDESSLMIILNRKHGRAAVFDEKGYRGRFGELIKDVQELDLIKDINGVLCLQDAVKLRLRSLPGIGDPLPPSWVKIRETLLKEKVNYISFDRFKEICRKYDIEDYNIINTLSMYFNRIGVFTHFIEDPLLKDRIYLNSNWLVKIVYKILDDPEIIEKQGRINESDIDRIWLDNELHFERDRLAQLMHKFGLMYHVKASAEYVVPAHLPGAMPYNEWEYTNKGNVLTFIYEFDKYMPKGLMSQIIVSLHVYIKDQNLVWLRGVNIEHEGTQSEIIETYETANRFRIRVFGTCKESLLAIIREHIAAILKPFSKLNYKQLIPCICADCRNSDNPHFYEYSNLLRRKEKNITEVECEKSFEKVRVSELLQIIQERIPDLPGDHKQDIKIFIASSEELIDDRNVIKEITEEISRSGKITIKSEDWKDKKLTYTPGEYQDYLNLT